MSLAINPPGNQALSQARALVVNLSPKQRYVIGGGVLGVVAAILLLVHLMTPVGNSVLYSNLQPADSAEVTSVLGSLGIPFTTSTDGTSVSVPANQLDRARLLLAAKGLPHSGQLGFELFDKTNWSGSDFDEQVNYQRALEGELERTIETIQGVRNASVQLTMAHDSVFTADDRPAKAAVLLTLDGGSLSPDMATAIQHLVASAVDNLNPSDVAILDANGNLVSGTNGPNGVPAQSQLENQLTAKLLATLAPVVGAAHVRASVAVQYDPTSGDDTQETYNPQGSAVLSSQRSTTANPGLSAAGGVPGTTSNLPKAQAPGTNFNAQLGLSSGGGQQSDSETYAVSRTIRHDVRPADTIQRISAAVLVDNTTSTVQKAGKAVTVSVPRSPQELQQLQSLAAAAIGIDTARGDVLTVTNLPFVAPPAPVPAAPAPPPGLLDRLNLESPTLLIAAAGALCLLLLLAAAGFMLTRKRVRRPRAVTAATSAPAATTDHSTPAGLPEAVEAEHAPNPKSIAKPRPELINVAELLLSNPDDAPAEMKAVLRIREQLAERVRHEPNVAGRLVQNWMNRTREEKA